MRQYSFSTILVKIIINGDDSGNNFPSLYNDSLELELHFDDIAEHVCVISNL